MDLCVTQYNEFLWQTMSIVAIVIASGLLVIRRLSEDKYPVAKMLMLGFGLMGALAIWMKARQVIPHYREEGLIDMVLLGAIVILAVDFLFSAARASAVKIAHGLEQRVLQILALSMAAIGIILVIFGSPFILSELDRVVDLLLQPFWVIAAIIIVVHSTVITPEAH